MITFHKVGKFYDAFADDGVIIHYLFGYKIVEERDMVGFPEESYMKVITKLQDMNISYKVLKSRELVEEYKGIDKNYQNVLSDALKNLEIEKRVNRLVKKLSSLELEELEEILGVLENYVN